MFSVFVKASPRQFLLALLLLLPLAGCSGEDVSPEDQVRQVISDFEAAVESGSITDAAPFIGATYKDKYHPNKRAAVRSLFGYMRRHKNVHLFARIQEVEVNESLGTARAVVQVAMTGEPVESEARLIALKADLYRFQLDMRWDEDEDVWGITAAEWKRANLGGLAR